MKKTKLQIIEELFDNGYCKDPSTRSLDSSDSCVYQNEKGNNCAVGKCLIDPVKIDNLLDPDVDSSVNQISDLENELKEEYRGHEVEFWGDLQVLHDRKNYWNDQGMTSDGKDELQALKLKYGKDN